MQTKFVLSTIAALAAAVFAATSLPAAAAADPLRFLGTPVRATDATNVDQVVIVNANTAYVNVTGGSTVRFVVDGTSFVWSFKTGGNHVAPFDLTLLAPAGSLSHKVIVYVSNDSLYYGG